MIRALLALGLLGGPAHAQEGEAASDEEVDPYAAIQAPHGAERTERTRRGTDWDAWGEARLRAVGGTDPALDPEGTTTGRTWWLSSRVIAGADWRPTERIEVALELEALNGQFASYTDIGTDYADDVLRRRRADARDLQWVIPRKAYVQATVPGVGLFRVGAQTFDWGTGILANDGAGDVAFADGNTGSVVARVLYATRPAANTEGASVAARGVGLFVAGDVVLRDDNASLFQGDLALAGLLGFRALHPRYQVGAYGVVRWQRDREDAWDPREERTSLLAFPVDAHAKVLLTNPGAPSRVTVEAEGFYIAGRTDRPYLDETREDGARLAGGGFVGRVRYDSETARVTALYEGGFATGDNDPRDDVVRQASFHTDYNVGLLLFDQVLPMVTARAADQLADPELLGQPPAGVRYTVNQGVVSNAVYLWTVHRWRPTEDLDLRLGYLAAWSAGDFVDAYETGIRGGYNTTPGGQQPGGRFYGHEVDLGARYWIPIPGDLVLEVGAEGGLFVPGNAFDGIAGDRMGPQGLGRGRITLGW